MFTFGAMSAVMSAWAGDEAAPVLQQIVIVATTPVPGMTIPADKVPGNVQTLYSNDLRQDGTASLITGLSGRLSSINLNDSTADPFQPDILYRGFEASSVLGTPQGLAVYQNGVRINEAFGDTVNWDLLPDIAISRVDLLSANPLFGLNALGGAVAVTMKNGFSFQGHDAELSGGSFDQRQGAAEFGANYGKFGIYTAARWLNQDGWRVLAQDALRQYYLDLALRDGGISMDLSYTRADNALLGQGAAPIQSLAIDRDNVFTHPQANVNSQDFVALNAGLTLTDTLAAQSVVYLRNFRQTVSNGNASAYTACLPARAPAALCQADGATPLTDAAGGLIADLSKAGMTHIGENDFERIDSRGLGASWQLTQTAAMSGRGNGLAVGATVDAAQTRFLSGRQVGTLDASLGVEPVVQVYTPEQSAGVGTEFSATPVILDATNTYYGLYVTDSFEVTPAFSLLVSGRYNIAKIDLSDRRGTALNGNNRFTHFNPALGTTYKLSSQATAYLGYSTNNRVPTANEIECSDPLRPCLLPSSLAGDPPLLRQVVAHTLEAGLRGQSAAKTGKLAWNAGVFRTNSKDDIYGIASSLSSGFFQNIGSTRRQGFESGINGQFATWSVYAQFSHLDATFRSTLLMHSPFNPFHDSNGNIGVVCGDRLPLIPANRLKLGIDFAVSGNFSLGASLALASGAFYRGDESNQNAQLPGYHVLSVRTSYRLNRHLEIFAHVQNVFDARYATFGLFSDPTGVGAPGIPSMAPSNAPGVDNRFQSPAMPRAFFGGVKIGVN